MFQMRERYDEEGNLKGYHCIIFDEIPDDYKMKPVILQNKVPDLSYLGIMKYLRDIKAGDEFDDNEFYSSEVISKMALDYLQSAVFLQKGVQNDRNQEEMLVSHYLIPCAYLCKHSIELKLKECLLAKKEKNIKGHSVLKLWEILNESQIPHYSQFCTFVQEVEKIDSNEMALRYGISNKLEPLQEKFKFNIDALINNTMFLFNVLDEFVICKYRFSNK